MNISIGTRSLLFGYHQFIIHPLLLAWCWTRLFGFPLDPRLWVCFFLHDVGYWGKPNMDGPEGEQHPYAGARLVSALFDRRGEPKKWYWFCVLHSRFIAKQQGESPSKLCYADKAVIAYTPTWIQLGLMRLTGEWREYVQGQNGRTAMPENGSLTDWANAMRKVCRDFVEGYVCLGCKHTIDAEVCGCGMPKVVHGREHYFIPMGCVCGYAKGSVK